MADNRFKKYAAQQPNVFIADPTIASEEARKAEEMRLKREAAAREDERIRLARSADERAAAGDARTAQKDMDAAEQREQVKRAQASGISDSLFQMRGVIAAAKEAKKRSNDWFATGFGAETALKLGGTSAADVEALLNTIGSNTAFDRLQKMREESPTGGALGAVSEIELRLLRDSIASLSQKQSDEQFQANLDRVIEAYQRVAGKLQSADRYYRENGSLDGFTPPSEEELAALAAVDDGPAPPGFAGAGATEESVPVDPAYQREYEAFVRLGNWTPEQYAAKRAELDQRFEYDTGADYLEEGARIRQQIDAGGPLNLTIPPTTRALSARAQGRNDFANSAPGGFLASMANAGSVGALDLMLGDQLDAMREASPTASFLGEMVGGVTGAGLTGGALRGASKYVGGGDRVAELLSNPAVADAAYSGLYGAAEADDPIAGLLTGAASGLVGNVAGSQIAKRAPALVGKVRPDDILGRGERAVYDVTGDTNPVAAALMQADELGVPMTLADASPELGSLAGSATRFSPATAGTARSVMAQRNQGQLDRLGGAVERDLGPVTNIPQRNSDLVAQAKAQAAPLYREAYAAPGAEMVDLSDLQDRPTFAAALREAYQEALDENVDPSAIGLQVAGENIMVAQPSWQSLDYVKRGLDNIIENNTSKIDGAKPAAKRAIEMKNILLGRMDSANPSYAEARRVYAGPMQERDFLQRGERAINARPDQLGVDIADLTPEQASQMRLGYQSEVMGKAGDLRGNSNPWAQLNTPNTEGRLGVLYDGAEDANIPRLLSQRDLELQLAGSANRLIGNSATAERSVADEFFKQQPGIGGDVAQGVAETALLGGPFLTVGKRIGDRLFRDRREAAALQANRSLADELGPILLNDVPGDAVAELTDIKGRGEAYATILEELIRSAMARGGHVGAGTGAVINANVQR